MLGGFLADPVALYPSLFPPDSVWASYPFLLPNLAVAILQAISFIVASLFLPETHPEFSDRLNLRIRIWQALRRVLGGRARQAEGQYVPLPGDQANFGPRGQSVTGTNNHEEEPAQELQDMSTDKQSLEFQNDEVSETKQKGAFTLQVVLQIISVSLLAFHKVSSDAIIPTFLAAPSTPPDSRPTPGGLLQTPGGFGYSNQEVGVILLSQAIVALVTQATLVPFFIDRVGPLRAYRIVLGIYPAMYIFTPLLPKLPPALSLAFVAFDLWIKVVLSSIGYICSAILQVFPTYFTAPAVLTVC